MPILLNLVYIVVLVLLSPWLIYKAITTGKYRRGFWTKLTGRASPVHGASAKRKQVMQEFQRAMVNFIRQPRHDFLLVQETTPR